MILDKETLIADNLAFDGSTTALDLEAIRPGPGEPLKLFIRGNGLAGATGVQITDSTDGSSYNPVMEVSSSEIVNGIVEFELPSSVKRFINATLVGTVTAGTWSCGVVLPGVQTAQ